MKIELDKSQLEIAARVRIEELEKEVRSLRGKLSRAKGRVSDLEQRWERGFDRRRTAEDVVQEVAGFAQALVDKIIDSDWAEIQRSWDY